MSKWIIFYADTSHGIKNRTLNYVTEARTREDAEKVFRTRFAKRMSTITIEGIQEHKSTEIKGE